MGTFKLRNFTLVSFPLLFFTLFTCNITATSTPLMFFNPLRDEICKLVSCGQGTCQATDVFPGFQCNCAPGWTKLKTAGFEFPSCILPNCTLDLKCGNGAPPPIAPPPPPFNLNFTDPCMLTLCLDGTCERNGTEFRCQCHEDSANLMNNPKLPCFKKCSFGADCNGVDLGFGSPPPPPPPPQENSSSPGTGSGETLNCSRHFHMLTMTLLATLFLTWI